jgi:hypothetical protein
MQRLSHRRELHRTGQHSIHGKEVLMSAHQAGKMGPLSRRGFLRTGAESAAAALAAGIAGCARNTGEPTKMGILAATEDTVKPADGEPSYKHSKFRDSQPAISYAEGMKAVTEFRKQHVPKLMPHSSVHRVQLMTDAGDADGIGDAVYIEVIAVDTKVKLPEHFSYRPPGSEAERVVEVRLTVRDPAVPHVRLGQPARMSALPATGGGTVGWNICAVINGAETVVCMTARHVLCANFFTFRKNLSVLLNDQPYAMTERVETINQNVQNNMFDLGLARYNNPELVTEGAEKLNRQCQTGYLPNETPYGYPMRIMAATEVATGQAYHKIGAASPICNEANLTHYLDAYCDVSVPYMDGTTQRFVGYTGCLVFGPFCKKGDSGSVVANNTDWGALGLHFAGTDNVDSISCPLFNLNWTRDPNRMTYDLWVPSTMKTRVIPRFILP